MSMLPTTVVIRSIVELLTEAYDGPPNPESTWFIDNEPDSGILGILKRVSAADASTPVDGSDEAGSTIAGNAEHLRWSLAMSNAAMRGEPFDEDWKDSWRVARVDEAEWERLQAALRGEYERLRQALLSQTEVPEEYLTGVLALLPHAAYHLGTIRHMSTRLKR